MDDLFPLSLVAGPVNRCEFSTDRVYRYTLEHSWALVAGKFVHVDLPDDEKVSVMWIGLNPSIADEQQLDPTLRRVRAFSHREDANTFVMTNLFAFRATDPADMRRSAEPVGVFNDQHLRACSERASKVVACWGMNGDFLGRDVAVTRALFPKPLLCLGETRDGFPRHPLYVAGSTPLKPFRNGASL